MTPYKDPATFAAWLELGAFGLALWGLLPEHPILGGLVFLAGLARMSHREWTA